MAKDMPFMGEYPLNSLPTLIPTFSDEIRYMKEVLDTSFEDPEEVHEEVLISPQSHLNLGRTKIIQRTDSEKADEMKAVNPKKVCHFTAEGMTARNPLLELMRVQNQVCAIQTGI